MICDDDCPVMVGGCEMRRKEKEYSLVIKGSTVAFIGGVVAGWRSTKNRGFDSLDAALMTGPTVGNTVVAFGLTAYARKYFPQVSPPMTVLTKTTPYSAYAVLAGYGAGVLLAEMI